jgi:hypothetical protein
MVVMLQHGCGSDVVSSCEEGYEWSKRSKKVSVLKHRRGSSREKLRNNVHCGSYDYARFSGDEEISKRQGPASDLNDKKSGNAKSKRAVFRHFEGGTAIKM